MKIPGISGSLRAGATTARLLLAVLAGVEGCETEFVSLAGKRIGACIAGLGRPKDNVCKVRDDMAGLRPKIAAADACAIGGANYYSMLSGLTHAFLERFYIDHEAASGENHHLLPVPAVFIGGTDDVIAFFYANPDYKVRLAPEVLLAAKAAIRKWKV